MNDNGRNVPYFPLKLAAGEDGWEAYNPVENSAYVFNAYAKHLLALCDGYNTFSEIVATISAQYGLDPAACQDSVAAVLDPLTEAGMVWWREQRVQPTLLPPPQSVFWELTWRCNLRCIHCVVSAGEREGNEPTTRELKGIAWQLARAGLQSVTYSGGEPLSRPDFFEVAEHVAELGLSAQMATNGLLITEEVAMRLRRLNIATQITLNGATAPIHDAFTGVRGSWDKSIRAIQLLIAAGVPVTIATIATKRNATDVPAIIDLAAGLGVTVFRLIPFVPCGRGRQHRELELTPREMRQLTVLLREIRASGRINILPLEFEETLDPPPMHGCSFSTHIGCDGAIAYCTIGTTGDVLPCSFFSGVAADSLRDRPFQWIWTNSHFLNYFRSLNVSDLESECATCSYLAVCRGGCRATNRSLGALFAGNAHCWAACGG
jgi:radical SAM protein with 4Fe4S-binding SPASM domain